MRLLVSNQEAAEARVERVLGARREVLAAAFIFGDDPFTMASMSLLRDARRRGLEVKVLVDAQWNKMTPAVLAHLLDEGIEIREYHWFRLDRIGWIYRRMHDKLLVTDGAGVIAGGRNVESTYYGLGRQIEKRNYLDLDMEVEGEVARDARAYFLRTWASRHVRPIRPKATEPEQRAASERLDEHKRWVDLRVEEATSNGAARRQRAFVEVGPVRFLHDPIGERHARGVGRELRDLLAEAKQSALIESPYLIPSRKLRAALEEALARGVRIRILTNSLGTTDNLFVQAGYVGHKKELVAMGIELWEYSGPDTLHSKAALIDGETVIVGSYNLDPLSESKNSELALVVRDPRVAAELATSFDEHLTQSWRIDSRGWPEGHDEPFPGVSHWKVCRMRLLRLLVPFIEGIL